MIAGDVPFHLESAGNTKTAVGVMEMNAMERRDGDGTSLAAGRLHHLRGGRFKGGTALGATQEKPLPVGPDFLQNPHQQGNEQSEQKAREQLEHGTGDPKGETKHKAVGLMRE